MKRGENDVWETLVKPGKKAKPGTRISFGDGLLVGEVVDVVEEGNRLIHFEYKGIFEEILDQLGRCRFRLILPISWKTEPDIIRYMRLMKDPLRRQLPAFTLHRSF